MRIHVFIVDHVVAMIAKGSENGVEINGIHTQVSQVIEILLHTLQVSAIELDHRFREFPLWLAPTPCF